MLTNDPSIIGMDAPHFWAAMNGINEKRAAMPRIMPSTAPSDMAQINVHGLLMPVVPDILKEWGADATGYQDIADSMRAAADDPAVKSILMHVDSGGGYVKGVDVAASAIAYAATQKPVVAYVDGMAASAAYWLTAQATTIQATALSEVGGIGVYSTLLDTTGLMTKIGLRPIVVRSGAMKGTGEDSITDEQVAAQREIVDGIHEQFVAAVAQGRGIPVTLAENLANGKTYLAARAKDVRLVDQIVNAPQVGANLQGDQPMADETPKVVAETEAAPVESPAVVEPETVTEPEVETEATPEPESAPDPVALDRARSAAILAAFAHDPAFAAQCVKDGLSVEQAKAAHYDTLLAAQSRGGNPVAFSAPSESGAGIPQDWPSAVAHVAQRDGISASKAADWLVRNTNIKP